MTGGYESFEEAHLESTNSDRRVTHLMEAIRSQGIRRCNESAVRVGLDSVTHFLCILLVFDMCH